MLQVFLRTSTGEKVVVNIAIAGGETSNDFIQESLK